MQSTGVSQLRRALREKEAANYIGMSVAFLRLDRMNGPLRNRTPGPPFVKKGRRIIYLIDDLDRWLEEHRVTRRGSHAPLAQASAAIRSKS